MNIFIALKGSHFWFYISRDEAHISEDEKLDKQMSDDTVPLIAVCDSVIVIWGMSEGL